jgi:hypothetical protein
MGSTRSGKSKFGSTESKASSTTSSVPFSSPPVAIGVDLREVRADDEESKRGSEDEEDEEEVKRASRGRGRAGVMGSLASPPAGTKPTPSGAPRKRRHSGALDVEVGASARKKLAGADRR